MPRKKRQTSSTGVYHWINRGVNHKKLFHLDKDFEYFLKLTKEHKETFEISLYHYCLMGNHIHLLLKCDSLESLARFSQYIQRRYTYYYCKHYKWRGQLFQRMYKSLPINEDTYLLECGRYIERNPLRAKLIERMGEHRYSSYNFYAEGSSNELITASPAYLGLAELDSERRRVYKDYVGQERAYESLVDEVLLK